MDLCNLLGDTQLVQGRGRFGREGYAAPKSFLSPTKVKTYFYYWVSVPQRLQADTQKRLNRCFIKTVTEIICPSN